MSKGTVTFLETARKKITGATDRDRRYIIGLVVCNDAKTWLAGAVVEPDKCECGPVNP